MADLISKREAEIAFAVMEQRARNAEARAAAIPRLTAENVDLRRLLCLAIEKLGNELRVSDLAIASHPDFEISRIDDTRTAETVFRVRRVKEGRDAPAR